MAQAREAANKVQAATAALKAAAAGTRAAILRNATSSRAIGSVPAGAAIGRA
ncbi:hypothetical protein ACRAWD_16840 [Caulobacter segnis]